MEDAQWILSMCREFHCLPSQLLDEDAELLKYIQIVQRGGDREDGG